MIESKHLWAVGYDNMARAEEVCAEIARLADRHNFILHDTAIAVRYPDGYNTLNGEPFVPIPHSRHHALTSFLAGLALGAPPLAGPAVGTLARVVGCLPPEVGIDDDFVDEVQALMKPCTSALFVLDDDIDM